MENFTTEIVVIMIIGVIAIYLLVDMDNKEK